MEAAGSVVYWAAIFMNPIGLTIRAKRTGRARQENRFPVLPGMRFSTLIQIKCKKSLIPSIMD
jgi:hypothetical protein